MPDLLDACHSESLCVACVCDRELYRALKTCLKHGDIQAVHVHEPTLIALLLSQPDLLLIEGRWREEITRLRSLFPSMPLAVWSDDGAATSIVQALNDGADDYIAFSCGQEELCARVRAHVRKANYTLSRSAVESQDHQIRLDMRQRGAIVRGKEVLLTPTEYMLLWLFLTHVGKVLTHATLLQTVWGEAYRDEIKLLRVHIKHLRCKLEEDPACSYLETVVGIGYRFRETSRSLEENQANGEGKLLHIEEKEGP
ncbi:response regulator transcription factor [Ktedonobacter robiniae]|uniref:DNA-binding response regulator n=1 Tax=Ktedonobacter robiniae TaxID=2778365 RepID=A0ABQ3V413_9CHLR|nr:response regulator transcription factor [Ktedonobacter robiniae]GHO59215.1 DNA-binding response regulator [Ktedonobacter robiniae]